MRISRVSFVVLFTLLANANETALPGEPSSLLDGCREKDRRLDFYPVTLKARDVEGRVLMSLERSPDGVLTIQTIEESTPEGVFDAAAAKYVANLGCSKMASPIVGKFGIVFSLTPGPEAASFEGVETVHIKTSRVRRIQ